MVSLFTMGFKNILLCAVAGALAVIALRKWRVHTWGRCRSKRSMIGKTVVITGASSGLGRATAIELARRGARVILACRDISGGLLAAADVRRVTSIENVVVRYLDLSSFSSIRAFANGVLKSEMHLDVLVCNAGVFQCPLTLTRDGLEMQMGVNHLGHFLLTNLLLDRLKNSQPSRVVVARIKKIMQKDEEVGKVAAPVPVIIYERLLFLKELVSSVPDVQGDEEPYEVPPVRPKLTGVRKLRAKNGSSDVAGPSHSTTEETDSAEDEEDDYLEEETDDGSSENTAEAPYPPMYPPVRKTAYLQPPT
ncbi:hypothetical protein HPB50_013890 [Hyalomma asiaticum]|uniref:Uncharacterized protein n=1 Tax=Hyalomma asiaticum TaxID=266040 RepID=A0ACB7RMN9_HYAAI|nr:hypothetical protein HPB50_013890 [Hyalomma asiaticum]